MENQSLQKSQTAAPVPSFPTNVMQRSMAPPVFQLETGDGEASQETDPFPWSVSLDGGNITFQLGEGENEKSETHSVATVRDYILTNYNWNGMVHLMKLVADEDDQFTYTVPSDLAGNATDNAAILPDAGILAIIRQQAKHHIEAAENPAASIDAILTAVDGAPGNGFATNVLDTTYTALVDERDNSSMTNGDTEFTMPDLSTADDATLYTFLKNLVLSRNGLWSDREQVTNMVSLRRSIDTNSAEYNDTMFVAWLDDGEMHVNQYIGSTEPGDIAESDDGKLLSQTLTVVPGIHTGGSSATVGGRTRNAFRKERNGTDEYFQSGDTSMNVHYGHPDVAGLPMSYGFDNNSDGSGYDESQTEAYLTLVRMYQILSRWGDGKTSKVSAFNNLKRWAATYTRGEVQEDADGNKSVDISNGDSEVEKTLEYNSYSSFIDSAYADTSNAATAATRLDRAQKLLINAGTAEADLEGKTLEELRALLKTEAVWLSVIDLQMNEEVNLGNVDAKPGGGTVGKLERTDEQIATDTAAFTEKKQKAETDWPTMEGLLETWSNNSTLQNNTALLNRLKTRIKINENDYNTDTNIGVDNSGGEGRDKNVGGWSDGCQIVLGGQNFYDYLGSTTQFADETDQDRWYYTIVDLDQIDGVTAGVQTETGG